MKRRKFTSSFKAKVVLEALSDRYTIQELGRKYAIHPTQITNWKTQFVSQVETLFERPARDAKKEPEEREEALLKTIDQLKVEVDFLEKASLRVSP